MRKFLIPIVAAASALAVAAPASAQYVQWAPPVYQYNPYNYGYGFSGINFARSMADRVQRIRHDIRVMQQRRVLSWNEARNLDMQAQNLQRRISARRAAASGPVKRGAWRTRSSTSSAASRARRTTGIAASAITAATN